MLSYWRQTLRDNNFRMATIADKVTMYSSSFFQMCVELFHIWNDDEPFQHGGNICFAFNVSSMLWNKKNGDMIAKTAT
jgi:ATP-dependent protease HslVU (ClpYQ) peptidase subunit